MITWTQKKSKEIEHQEEVKLTEHKKEGRLPDHQKEVILQKHPEKVKLPKLMKSNIIWWSARNNITKTTPQTFFLSTVNI